ncbi:MAG TPA: hypothetical protein VLB69_04035, partial [Rudaea sp.]|nr:hypothetical protein [Rudaea sp.]
MQLADAIPFGGVGTEVSLRSGGARLPHRSEPLAIARNRLVGGIQPLDQGARDVRASAMLGEAKERPGAFAESLDQPGLDQQLEVPRNARLR